MKGSRVKKWIGRIIALTVSTITFTSYSLAQTPQRYAMDFESSNNEYALITNEGLTFAHNPITYAFWFNIPSGGGGRVMGNGHNGEHGRGGVEVRENVIRFDYTAATPFGDVGLRSHVAVIGSGFFGLTNPITADVWHHAAFVIDFSSQVGTIYLDGENVNAVVSATKTDYSPSFSTNQPEYFGSRHVNTLNHFEGSLDEISIWSVALTATEIRDYIYRSIDSNHPQYAGLEAYWKLDDNGTTTSALEETGAWSTTLDGTGSNVPAYIDTDAPIGDSTAYLHNSSGIAIDESITVTLPKHYAVTTGNRGILTVTVKGGAPTTVAIYGVDHLPNNATYTSCTGCATVGDEVYWGIHVVGGTNVSLDVDLDYSEHENFKYNDQLRVMERTDNTQDWTLATISNNMTSNLISIKGFSGGELILGSIGGTLPVTLTSFTVQQQEEKIQLDWTTADEVNNDRFEIERSPGNISEFKTIGTVPGNGSSEEVIHYEFTDENPPNGNRLYYRLKQIDFNGEFEYSEVISLKGSGLGSEKPTMTIFPNPAKQMVRLETTGFRSPVTLLISDLNGTLYFSRRLTEVSQLELDLAGYREGVYLVIISDPFTRLHQKLVIN